MRVRVAWGTRCCVLSSCIALCRGVGCKTLRSNRNIKPASVCDYVHVLCTCGGVPCQRVYAGQLLVYARLLLYQIGGLAANVRARLEGYSARVEVVKIKWE